MPAMEPASLLRFLRKLKEVFDVCDEDADGFIRVEHFVALGLQFGQGDEVSGATPGPPRLAWPGPLPRPPAAAQLSPAAAATRGAGPQLCQDHPDTPPPSPTFPYRGPNSPRLSGSPRLLPSGRPSPSVLRVARTPPVPQGVPEPTHGGLDPLPSGPPGHPLLFP